MSTQFRDDPRPRFCFFGGVPATHTYEESVAILRERTEREWEESWAKWLRTRGYTVMKNARADAPKETR
jgi:hypothetical protein